MSMFSPQVPGTERPEFTPSRALSWIGRLAQPLFLGLAIDGLLRNSSWELVLFMTQFLCWTVLELSFRRRDDSSQAEPCGTTGHVLLSGSPILLLGFYDLALIPLCLGVAVPAVLLRMSALRLADCPSQNQHSEKFETLRFGVMRLFSLLALAAGLISLSQAEALPPGGVFAALTYLTWSLVRLDRLTRPDSRPVDTSLNSHPPLRRAA